jgi:hypothetical protein
MDKKHTHHNAVGVSASMAILAITAGIGLCELEPVGRKAGVIQFDALNELTNNSIASDHGLWPADTIWFARYWVCRDYYAVSIVWTEPQGLKPVNLKTLAILSDRDGFRVDDDQFLFWVPLHTTYPKPLGERGPFAWRGGFYRTPEMRFAEAEALSRRVHVDDLEPLWGSGKRIDETVNLKAQEGPDGIKRKLAQLKVQAEGDRIESLDLLGNAGRKLAGIKYEYDGTGKISRLMADLPVRPEKLAVDVNMTITVGDAKLPYRRTDVDYVYHKGGRTCAVTYQDVTVGDTHLRLPVRVEVRRSDDKRLVRSAKLMNFRRVDLDKAAVWEAAKAYGRFSSEDRTAREIANKFLYHQAVLGPLKVDPDDLAFARGLIAKYPTPERVPPVEPGMSSEAREQQLAEWRQRIASTPKPKPVAIEPNDARLIRQLIPYYAEKASGLTEEQRQKMRTGQSHGPGVRTPTESQRKFMRLRDELSRVLMYHRAPVLPEDRAPEPNDLDLKLIRSLRGHYEALVAQQDDTLGERLKALDARVRLDLAAKDYDAFERGTVLYLQMLRDANLPAMYLVGGYDGHIDCLIEAGQFDRAKRLLRLWADRSALDNEADTVYRFCGSDSGGQGDPWVAVQLLDRFLKKPGLSPIERYEALALRAIAFDKIDKLLATPAQDRDINTKSGEGKALQVKWILSATTRTQIAKMVEPAVREAVSAWQSLGAAKDNEAKPYSTIQLEMTSGALRSLLDSHLGSPAPATRLQETSAELNKIVRQRSGPQSTKARSGETQQPAAIR